MYTLGEMEVMDKRKKWALNNMDKVRSYHRKCAAKIYATEQGKNTKKDYYQTNKNRILGRQRFALTAAIYRAILL